MNVKIAMLVAVSEYERLTLADASSSPTDPPCRAGGTATVSKLRSRATRRPTMPTLSKRPDTIVLVHGFWVTPRSWEHWIPRYEAQGYRVLAPAYPGFEVEVEALNRDPSPVERLTAPA